MDEKFHVPFKTAQRLKEKGYPQGDSDMYYDPNGKLFTRAKLNEGYKEEYPIMITYYTTAPTYHEVLDWLEGYGIYVTCSGQLVKQCTSQYTASTLNNNTNEWCMCGVYPTREEALNAGILAALKKL